MLRSVVGLALVDAGRERIPPLHRIQERHPPMVYSSNTRICLLASTALLATACGGGSTVSNASPRITEVPQQSTLGGTAFSIDLSTYVADREAGTLTYSVVSGGGSFAGSTYTNTFDTIGEYDVVWTVSDGAKDERGTFKVVVTSANFVAVTEDAASLLLLDSATNKFVRVTSTVPQPSYVTLAGVRTLVYRLGANGKDWIYNAYTGLAKQLAADVAGGARYVAKTSDGKLVYTTGSAPSKITWYYNPTTTVARNISDGGLSTLSVLVNSSDLVFFEDSSNAQADIAFYDPAEDEVVSVSAAPTDEQLLAVLPDGGVVFSRVGDSGESDLFYFRVGSGLVEIGADVGALAARNKTFQVNDSNSKVVFTALNGSNEELFVWNPSNGQTTTIAAGVNTTVFSEVGTGNEVVYNVVVSGTEEDTSYYDLDDGTTAVLRNSTDIGVVSAVVSDGTTSWALIRGSGALNDTLAVSLAATPDPQTWSAASPVSDGGRLANGDYVEELADGTALNIFDVSAGTWGTPITGAGLDFQGDGLEDGDFVYAATVSAQADLNMWDASATASVAISSTAGDDAFAAKTLDGTILFTRKVGTNTTRDLFVWDGTTATRLTDEDSDGIFHDYTAVSAGVAVTRL